ncbi:MAG: UDP-N-acetylglucosamine 1-carboxyvinyltransferase [Deltaproteobacteria bacterium]|nr:UDP-N-acetylglucosamine 1-carboxyvinyltransferase [Deltaproteobacteria bacterium]
MDQLMIEGPNFLSGRVQVSGSKNAALPILAATLMGQGTQKILNVPNLGDIRTILNLLTHLGASVKKEDSALLVCADSVSEHDVPYELVKTMRASILVLGPLLARFGKAKVSLPGGCAIGERPINLHLMGLQKLGAQIEISEGYIYAQASKLTGTKICFDDITVNGTQNIMMAATLAKGVTLLENAAKEPEVVDLAHFLNKMGANISGAGTDTMIIEGVETLGQATHEIIPDRIEAGTLVLAVAATGGNVRVEHCAPQHLGFVLDKLMACGVHIEQDERSIWVKSNKVLEKINMETKPYPGFPTDLQAQMMAFLTQTQGTSRIVENIFEKRFNHVAELGRMGAQITIDGRCAMVEGGKKLSGAPVMATDLRASASLVIAGLVAHGRTEISRVYHLDRGYEQLEEKLKNLGARIYRVSNRECKG